MTSPYLQHKPRSLFQAIRDLRQSGCIDMDTARELLLGVGPAVDRDGEDSIVKQGAACYPDPRWKGDPVRRFSRESLGRKP